MVPLLVETDEEVRISYRQLNFRNTSSVITSTITATVRLDVQKLPLKLIIVQLQFILVLSTTTTTAIAHLDVGLQLLLYE